MKGVRTAALLTGLVALLGVGVGSAVTNPSEAAYNKYAAEQLGAYLKDNICSQAPTAFGLQKRCLSLAANNRGEMEQLIAENTQRQDYIFFSTYQTDLSINSLLPPYLSLGGSFLPAYRFETVGAFNTFYIHKAQRR
ncbi:MULTISPECIES: DUF4359 domain-containing protein [Trichocoleus]|uniref:DUF4359 domain-containing protein n=1 Tax=Trichocoleus desertorum GB2-A4 TaxID=2933944 RepID=A0ABV0J6C1_9CYAN|nr:MULTISPECIES: DUF4359 domain-containing protein [unclassified Trichocoleus]MBD1863425.1 DUF4359 domain-containing protein [Trichocoleus sp. FACHB-46]MBD2099027.1 DUF4359 domain-containing protein [Trichocoleus sp. FACHB-591]